MAQYNELTGIGSAPSAAQRARGDQPLSLNESFALRKEVAKNSTSDWCPSQVRNCPLDSKVIGLTVAPPSMTLMTSNESMTSNELSRYNLPPRVGTSCAGNHRELSAQVKACLRSGQRRLSAYLRSGQCPVSAQVSACLRYGECLSPLR